MTTLTTATDRKSHWDRIYSAKKEDEVSWYQPTPFTSLQLINELNLPSTARIIDSGAGESHLVDHLLEIGYSDITLLDISEVALSKTKERLGQSSSQVKWIVSDLLECEDGKRYDLWHDRAAFHFLIDRVDIARYVSTVKQCVRSGGYLIVATFSDKGPMKCSGLDIMQYTEESMVSLFNPEFEKVKCFTVDHHTPFNTRQNFLFCCFKRI